MTETPNKAGKERIKKQYAGKGIRTQKMMTFRADYEVLEYLQTKPNKGRYLNDLVIKAMKEEQQ